MSATTESAVSTTLTSFAALRRNRDFRLLWYGQATSEFGSAVAVLATPLLAVALTGSELLAGLVGTVGFLAMWLAQIPGGYTADMFDRRRVMLWCDGARAGLIGLFAVSLVLDVATIWWLFALSTATSVLSVFFGAAQGQAVRQIVAREQIPEAVGITKARASAIAMVGPSVGGALFAVGRAVPMVVDALSFLGSMAFVYRIRTPLRPENQPAVTRLLPDLGKGWSTLWRNPFLRAQAIYSTVTNITVSVLMYLLIIGHADDSALLGVSVAIAAGGGVIGSLAAPFVQRTMSLRTILVAVAVIRGAVLLAVTWQSSTISLAIALATVMLVGPAANAALAAAQILLVPADVYGRASSTTAFISSALLPLAPFSAGLLLYTFTPAVAQLTVAAGFAGVALVAAAVPGLTFRPGQAGES